MYNPAYLQTGHKKWKYRYKVTFADGRPTQYHDGETDNLKSALCYENENTGN